ncbi:DUF3626 domain-containing protein [Microtetraspora sp. AC03309]|nr:DUF3626 domain-containing protein [Microtetraspora sp. AC03309]
MRERPDEAIADGFAAILELDAERSRLARSGRRQEADALSSQFDGLLERMERLVPDPGERAFYEQYAQVRKNIELLAEEEGLSVDAATEIMRAELVELLGDKPVVVGIWTENLLNVLGDGRFKSQFETARSEGLYDPVRRAAFEEAWFGYPSNLPARLRPIYGYVNTLATLADSGAGRYTPLPGGLSLYGDAQVTLRPGVRTRTTICVGDSLTERKITMPSPMLDPRPVSFGAFPRGYVGDRMPRPSLRGLARDYTDPKFLRSLYVEAQIHGGVTVADIEHVMFVETPPPDVQQALDAARIPWDYRFPRRS